jgi:hypothetical protein
MEALFIVETIIAREFQFVKRRTAGDTVINHRAVLSSVYDP